MNKKIALLIVVVLTTMAVALSFYFLYHPKSTSTDSFSDSKTTPGLKEGNLVQKKDSSSQEFLNLKEENLIADLSRDTKAKTATLKLRLMYNDSLESGIRNSPMYKDLVVSSCAFYQEYYYNPEFRKDVEDEISSLGISKSNVEKQIDEFLEGYSLKSVNIDVFGEDESRIYTCTITGGDEKDNLIGLFSSDGVSFSFGLDYAYDF